MTLASSTQIPNQPLTQRRLSQLIAIPPAGTAAWRNELFNPLRRLALYCAFAYIFIRYSLIHETITFLIGVNLKLVYLTAPVALLGILLTGGVQRTLKERVAWYWLGFTIWMVLAIPFSSWPGGSFDTVYGFLKTQISILFVLGGLAMTWSECYSFIRVLAATPLVVLFAGKFFAADDTYRLGLTWSSIGNQNDYAAHLLLVLPFTLYVGLRSGTPIVIRLAALGVVAYGLRQILATASRGALIALGVVAIFALWRGTNKQRLALVLLAPIAAIVLIALLPQQTLTRLTSFSSDDEDAPAEARESAQSREYLLRQSVVFTLQHPIFGIGPGQFANYEGKTRTQAGLRGNWHQTHNIFTQISSECGVPAFLFMVAGLAGTFQILNSIWREARERQLHDISLMLFCVMMSMTGFCAAATFLNLGYGYYLPGFAGLAIALKTGFRSAFPTPSLAGRGRGYRSQTQHGTVNRA